MTTPWVDAERLRQESNHTGTPAESEASRLAWNPVIIGATAPSRGAHNKAASRIARKYAPPQAWRAGIWLRLSGGEAILQKNPKIYLEAEANRRGLPVSKVNVVGRPPPVDPATVPSFGSPVEARRLCLTREGMQRAARVLLCLQYEHSEALYCPFLPTIVIAALHWMSEEEAFAMASGLLQQPCPLMETRLQTWLRLVAMDQLALDINPKAYKQLCEYLGVPFPPPLDHHHPLSGAVLLWVSHHLPFWALTRFIDNFVAEGDKTFFRFGLAILQCWRMACPHVTQSDVPAPSPKALPVPIHGVSTNAGATAASNNHGSSSSSNNNNNGNSAANKVNKNGKIAANGLNSNPDKKSLNIGLGSQSNASSAPSSATLTSAAGQTTSTSVSSTSRSGSKNGSPTERSAPVALPAASPKRPGVIAASKSLAAAFVSAAATLAAPVVSVAGAERRSSLEKEEANGKAAGRKPNANGGPSVGASASGNSNAAAKPAASSSASSGTAATAAAPGAATAPTNAAAPTKSQPPATAAKDGGNGGSQTDPARRKHNVAPLQKVPSPVKLLSSGVEPATPGDTPTPTVAAAASASTAAEGTVRKLTAENLQIVVNQAEGGNDRDRAGSNSSVKSAEQGASGSAPPSARKVSFMVGASQEESNLMRSDSLESFVSDESEAESSDDPVGHEATLTRATESLAMLAMSTASLSNITREAATSGDSSHRPTPMASDGEASGTESPVVGRRRAHSGGEITLSPSLLYLQQAAQYHAKEAEDRPKRVPSMMLTDFQGLCTPAHIAKNVACPDKLVELAFTYGFSRDDIKKAFQAGHRRAQDALSATGFNLAVGEPIPMSRRQRGNTHGVLLHRTEPVVRGTQCLLTPDTWRTIWHDLPLRFHLKDVYKVFDTSVHGYSLKSFYEHCGSAAPTVLCVKTMAGDVLGAFLTYGWDYRLDEEGRGYFGNGEIFVFKQKSTKCEVYIWVGSKHFEDGETTPMPNSRNSASTLAVPPTNFHHSSGHHHHHKASHGHHHGKERDMGPPSFFMHGSTHRVCVGGGSAGHAIELDASLRRGRSLPSDTFGSPSLVSSGGGDFEVAAVEVWAFVEHH